MKIWGKTRTFIIDVVVLLFICLFVNSSREARAQDPTLDIVGTLLPVQRDYYDVAGALWKTETFEVTTINGVPTPTRIVMKDLQGKTSTEQQITNVRYGVDIPDAIFDPMKLPAAAASSLWASSTTSPVVSSRSQAFVDEESD